MGDEGRCHWCQWQWLLYRLDDRGLSRSAAHLYQVARLPGSSRGCATRERSSEGKMGSQPGLLGRAEPPNFSLSALSVVMTAPGATAAAAPQSQGRPLLGQIYRAARTSKNIGTCTTIFLLHDRLALQHAHAGMIVSEEDFQGGM